MCCNVVAEAVAEAPVEDVDKGKEEAEAPPSVDADADAVADADVDVDVDADVDVDDDEDTDVDVDEEEIEVAVAPAPATPAPATPAPAAAATPDESVATPTRQLNDTQMTNMSMDMMASDAFMLSSGSSNGSPELTEGDYTVNDDSFGLGGVDGVMSPGTAAQAGVWDSASEADYVTTNAKVEEVMARVHEALNKDILLGQGYADAGLADSMIQDLTKSIQGLITSDARGALEEESSYDMSRSDAYGYGGYGGGGHGIGDSNGSFDESEVYFNEDESEMGYNPLTGEEVQAKQPKERKGFTLKEWEATHLRRMRKRQARTKSRQRARARKAALAQQRALQEENEKRKRLRTQAGYAWAGKYEPESLRSLKDWEASFGSRLRGYEKHKANKMKKLKAKIHQAVEADAKSNRPPRLRQFLMENPDTGVMELRNAWTYCLCQWDEPCACGEERDVLPVENNLTVLNNKQWVYKRLMVETRKREQKLAALKFASSRAKAERELEECFFAPQIKSKRRVPAPPKTSDPLRELGYEPRPYYGKQQVAEPNYTHSPRINNKSRAMVDPTMYRSTAEVCNRLAYSRARHKEAREAAAAELAEEGGAGDEGALTFRPKINSRSKRMSRDVTVFDRLFEVGMQQNLEKRRLQVRFVLSFFSTAATGCAR